MDEDNSDERFPPTGGRVLGALGLLAGVAIVVLSLIADDVSWAAVAFGVLFAGLAWSALLRPQVAIVGDELVLRNMLETVHLPLAALEGVAVRQVLAVRVGEKRYTSPAVGRPRRTMLKEDRSSLGDSDGALNLEGVGFGLFVQERIRERAQAERERLGIRPASDEQEALVARVRRVPAVPEIVWVLGSAVAFVVLVVV